MCFGVHFRIQTDGMSCFWSHTLAAVLFPFIHNLSQVCTLMSPEKGSNTPLGSCRFPPQSRLMVVNKHPCVLALSLHLLTAATVDCQPPSCAACPSHLFLWGMWHILRAARSSGNVFYLQSCIGSHYKTHWGHLCMFWIFDLIGHNVTHLFKH